MNDKEQTLKLMDALALVSTRCIAAREWVRVNPPEAIDLLLTGPDVAQVVDAVDQLRTLIYNGQCRAHARKERDAMKGGGH